MSRRSTSEVAVNSHALATGGNLRANGSQRFAARLRSISFTLSLPLDIVSVRRTLVRVGALRHGGAMSDSKGSCVALVVGGGPAPGINGVIAAATIEARNRGARVIGVLDG